MMDLVTKRRNERRRTTILIGLAATACLGLIWVGNATRGPNDNPDPLASPLRTRQDSPPDASTDNTRPTRSEQSWPDESAEVSILALEVTTLDHDGSPCGGCSLVIKPSFVESPADWIRADTDTSGGWAGRIVLPNAPRPVSVSVTACRAETDRRLLWATEDLAISPDAWPAPGQSPLSRSVCVRFSDLSILRGVILNPDNSPATGVPVALNLAYDTGASGRALTDPDYKEFCRLSRGQAMSGLMQTSDMSGRFEFRQVPPIGTLRFAVAVQDDSGDACEIVSTNLRRDDPQSTILHIPSPGVFDVTLRRDPRPRFRILVRSTDGLPIPGADVSLAYDRIRAPSGGDVPACLSGTTDKNGFWAGFLPRSAQGLLGTAPCPYAIFALDRQRGVAFKEGLLEGSSLDDEISLTPNDSALAVSGRIIDVADGSGVATLKVVLSSPFADGIPLAESTTDSTGAFTFVRIPRPPESWLSWWKGRERMQLAFAPSDADVKVLRVREGVDEELELSPDRANLVKVERIDFSRRGALRRAGLTEREVDDLLRGFDSDKR